MAYAQRTLQSNDAMLFDAAGRLVGLQAGGADTRALFPSAYGEPVGALPSAGGKNAGTTIRLTDVGPAGSEWTSDGTVWRPSNGSAVLYQSPAGSVAAPVATLTGNGATQYFSLAQPMLIPAGLLFSGAKLRISFLGQKAGTHTGVWRIGVATAADGTGYTQIVTQASNGTTATFVRGSSEAICYSGGFFTSGPSGMEGAAGTGTSASIADRTFATMLTAPLYVVIGIESSYSDSAANLIHYALSIDG